MGALGFLGLDACKALPKGSMLHCSSLLVRTVFSYLLGDSNILPQKELLWSPCVERAGAPSCMRSLKTSALDSLAALATGLQRAGRVEGTEGKTGGEIATCLYTYMHINEVIKVCRHVDIHIYMYTIYYAYVYAHTIPTFIQTNIHACMHTYIPTYIRTYIHAKHTYRRTHAHAYGAYNL